MKKITFIIAILLWIASDIQAQKRNNNKSNTKNEPEEEMILSEEYEETYAEGTFENPKIIYIKGEPYNAVDLGYGKWLFFNDDFRKKSGVYFNGKILLPPIFNCSNTECAIYNNERIILKFGYRYGVYDLRGEKWLLPVIYSTIKPLTSKYFIVKNKEKISIYDVEQKKFVRKDEWNGVEFNYPLKQKYKYIVSKYQNRTTFKGLYQATDNRMILPVIYNNIHYYPFNGLFVVEKKHKFNLFNLKGEPVFQKWYDEIVPVSKQHFIVKNNNLYQILDKNENPVKKDFYLSMKKFGYNDLTIILAQNLQHKYGYLSSSGQIYFPFVYDDVKIDSYYSFYHIVKQNGQESAYRIMDGKIHPVLPASFDNISIVKNHFLVKKKGLYGLYSIKGEELLPLKFSKINFLNKDYRGKSYFYAIDKNKTFIVSRNKVYKIPYRVEEELLLVPNTYKNPDFFIIVNDRQKHGLINFDGKLIVPEKFEKILYQIGKKYIVIEEKGKQGVYDFMQNQFTVPVKYDQVILKDKKSIYLITENTLIEKKLD